MPVQSRYTPVDCSAANEMTSRSRAHASMASRFDSSSDNTPVSLILRLREGTEAEWRKFWEIYGPLIYRLARGRGLNHHDAQDIVCEVMRGLHARIRRGLKVDHGKGRFRSYVARSVARATARFRRQFKKTGSDVNARPLTSSAEDGSDGDVAALERGERMRYCLSRLRESPDVRRRDFEAFERSVILGESSDKVAKRFGISRGRLYGIRSEMMNRLRVMLTTLDQELGET